MTLRAVKPVTSRGDVRHVAPSTRRPSKRTPARLLAAGTATDTDLLAGAVLLHIERASRILKARAERLSWQCFQLRLRQLWILFGSAQGTRTQGQIAELLGIDKNQMVVEVNRLERAGCLRRLRVSSNRRSCRLRPTAKGERVLHIAPRQLPRNYQRLRLPLTAKAFEAVRTFATKIIEYERGRLGF
jgi:DNA-binding MarR family transcriptional regulator